MVGSSRETVRTWHTLGGKWRVIGPRAVGLQAFRLKG